MSGLKVFVSSTCVDLNAERAQIRGLLIRLGHEPIMSDYSDILYDPRAHTHASCVREVSNADVLVLLIGSRFGGTTVPQAISLVDIDKLKSSSKKIEILTNKDRLSITQMEVLKAVEAGIPVFTFVDSRVYSDHHLYQTNKSSGIVDKIKFPSIGKQETAIYIFEFINFINHRVLNNSIVAYRNFSEIEDYLIKQWSLMFQRLLQEEKIRATEARRADIIIEQIEDMKAVILQSITQGNPRDAALNVLKFRRLVDFLLGFRSVSNIDFAIFKGSLGDLMENIGVYEIRPTNNLDSMIGRSVLILKDGTFFSSRLPHSFIISMLSQWDEFSKLDISTKQAIIDAVGDTNAVSPIKYFKNKLTYSRNTEDISYIKINSDDLEDAQYTNTDIQTEVAEIKHSNNKNEDSSGDN